MERKKPFRLLALLAVFTAFMLAVVPTPAWADDVLWECTDKNSGSHVSVVNVSGAEAEYGFNITVNYEGKQVATGTIEKVNFVATLKLDIPNGYKVDVDAEGMSTTKTADGYSLSGFVLDRDRSLTVNISLDPAYTRIPTDWGDIVYKNPTSDGYNMTVRLYLNGERVFVSDQFRMKSGENDCLNFSPNNGFYYHDSNGYDLYTKNDNSSWNQGTGYISIVGTGDDSRDYDNVLDIHLWTFEEYLPLNVTRAADTVNDVMTGYTISYDWTDPLTDEVKTYTQLITSFGGTQLPLIPCNTDVTVTAVCAPGWEITEWYNGDMLTQGNSWSSTEGIFGDSGEYARGNSVTMNYTDAFGAQGARQATLRAIEAGVVPSAPSIEDVNSIFDGKLVTVDCVSNDEHIDKEYGAIAGGVEIGTVEKVDGEFQVTLSIASPYYVSTYSHAAEINFPHMLKAETTGEYQVVLTWGGRNWTAPEGYDAADYKFAVVCGTQEPDPLLPDYDKVSELVDVKVECTTNEEHGAKSYEPIYGYRLSDPIESDEGSGVFTSTMTVDAKGYVSVYSIDLEQNHELTDTTTSSQAITLTYQDGQWTADKSEFVFNVKCVEGEPEGPGTPSDDDVIKAFSDMVDGAVKVVCDNDEASHNVKEHGYKLVKGAFTPSAPVLEDDAYVSTITVGGDLYANKFSNEEDIAKDHKLVGDTNTAELKVVYNEEAEEWEAQSTEPVTFTVACENPIVVPDQPTYEEILKATPQGAVTIDCTNAEVEHEDKTYSIEKGAYTLGEVNDADGDGIYTVDVQVSAGTYVLKFENDHEGIHHYLDPANQGAKTITLAYDSETDSWSVAGGSASPVTFTVLCDVEGTTDPGTDPDEPGTDPDEPGDEGDEPGTNPDDKPGDEGQGEKPGDQGGNGDQNKDDGANNGSGNGKLSQTGDVAALVAAAIAGAGALTAGAGYVAMRWK